MALVKPVFFDTTVLLFDTTVLLGGYIDFGVSSIDAQRILDAVAAGSIRDARTAWHCCLEFYAVATRLPPGYRLAPQQACRLLQEILGMFRVDQLPGEDRFLLLEAAVKDRVAGGRIYDAHIAEIARSGSASIVVTDNRRHFMTLIKHGVRVLQSGEFADEFSLRPAPS